MKRLTNDDPKTNLESALNLFYAKDGEAWVRGGGPEPNYEDVSLFVFIRRVIKALGDRCDHVDDIDNDTLSEIMFDWLQDGPESIPGVIGLLYESAWAFAEIRARLAAYEDTGLSPELIEEMRADATAMVKELATVKAERDAAMADIQRCCETCALCSRNNGTGEMCPWLFDCNQVDGDHWEWRGAKDTNVPRKSATDTNVGREEE